MESRLFRLSALFFLMSVLSGVAFAGTVMTFSPADGYIANPYMGLVAWSEENPDNLKQDFSLVYVDVTWAEIEPERGVYDFAALEERCQFSMWKSLGKRAVFRLVLDKPGKESHMDIPVWLYEMTGDGVFYDTSYGKGYCPDYENPVLIQEHENLIHALASWFRKDDFITFIQLGSVGHWGEWHIHPDVMDMPEISFLEVYLKHYVQSFVYGKTMLMMRRPFTIGLEYGIGLYNDSLGIKDSDERWLNWIEEGGNYETQKGGISAMPDMWKTFAIGGEISSDVSLKKLVRGKSRYLVDTLKASHSSWIGPNGFTGYKASGNSSKKNLAEILSAVGYRLYVSELGVNETGDGVRLDVTLANDGAAPFYFGWDVMLRVQTAAGCEVLKADVDVNDVLPGSVMEFSVTVNGDVFGVEIGIFNPEDMEEGICLVMDTSRDGFWYRLI